MKNSWQYPIFVIQHRGGYASIVDPTQPSQSLVVCTSQAGALGFMADCGIMGATRELQNDREFGWLLESLQDPVTEVVFDPEPQASADGSALRLPVDKLLDEHLVADNSPWRYPVFVVAQGDGFVSIEGRDSSGQPITAIGFFSDEQRVEQYLEAANEIGTPCALHDLEDTRAFLTRMAAEAAAVAWNPAVSGEDRVAKHCFSINTLLEKYLVVSDQATDH